MTFSLLPSHFSPLTCLMSLPLDTDLWPLIQEDILGVLLADEFIGNRNGVAVEPGDVESTLSAKVQRAIGAGKDGKVGCGFLVLPIEEAADENANVPGGPLKLTIIVQFVENVVLNRGPRGTMTPIRIFVSRAEKILKLYTPVNLTQNLVPVNPVINEFTPARDENLRIGQLKFTASEADDTPLQRLGRPAISVTGSALPYVVAVVQQAANEIYYTLDGSHPWNGNATAILYTDPVTVTEPCLFRARAFARVDNALTNIASDTAARTLA